MAKRSNKKRRTLPVVQSQKARTPKIPLGKRAIQIGLLLLQALVIVAGVVWIYWPALHGGWLMDDDYYITKNALLRDPYGLWNIWLAPGSLVEYYPIESSAQWFQWQLWGDDSFGYHVTNVVLHAINALLVWRLFSKFGLRLAWLGGLLFAVHPAQVESVAWVAEFKNLLSLLPFLLAMGSWIDYEERKRDRDYFLALGLFLIAMLCKITMSPFPVLILLYAWWKRGRIGWSDVKVSVPFFIISLALGVTTILAGIWYTPGHALEVFVPLGGFFSRLACAGLSISFYLAKFFLPGWLLPMYPQWILDPPTLGQFLPWPVFAGVLYWLWTKRHGWGRHVFLGLGFFLLFLLPFIGFHSISFMRFTWVMDHFLYLPLVGFIGLLIAALGHVDELLSPATRPYRIGIVAALIALLVFDSHSYAKMYIGQEALWTYTIEHNPEAWPAYNNLGNTLSDAGRLQEAMERYKQALILNPEYSEAHANLGIIYARTGRLSEGIKESEEALRINPDFPLVRDNLAQMQAIQQAQAAQQQK